MFRTTALIAALGLAPVLSTAVVLADGPATVAEEDLAITSGKVMSLDHDNTFFTLEVAPLEHVDVAWNDDTAFVLDGESSTAHEVLIVERIISVEHRDGLAVTVRGVSEQETPE